MLGFLMGAVGLGALAGAVYVASKKLNHSLPRTIVIASGFFGLGLSAFALSKSYHLSLLLLMGCGFALIVQIASTNTLIQTLTDDDKRGRVMSFYTMAFFGMAPIGSLLCGWLAESAGVQKTLFLSGLLIILGASMLFKKMTKKPTAGPALP
jgi:MFS family permease